MLPIHQDHRPLTALSDELNRVAADLNAICILATDESGGLVGVSNSKTKIDLQTLAALGTANLASSLQLLALTETTPSSGSLIALVEGEHTRLIVAGRAKGLIVIALLGVHSPLGLARIEMHELADINWELPSHNFSDDRTLVEQELGADGLFDGLFDMPGDDTL